jgi:D-alanine-D-alanine ligase
MKKTIAVFFGGPSCEHDVSILTGLQILEALNPDRYNAFPVYVALDGKWYVGDALRQRKNYMFSPQTIESLDPVMLPLGANTLGNLPKLISTKPTGFLKRQATEYAFDAIIPAFHGTGGEDGTFQGILKWLGIPFLGCDILPAALCMNKKATKFLLQSLNLPHLPYLAVSRGTALERIESNIKELGFPLCIKPCNLGSSVGVSKVESKEELHAALLKVFKIDHTAMIEPFVQQLEEYNVAVTRAFGETRVSAIELPERKANVLDFKDKYLSGGIANKLAGSANSAEHAGMDTANRILNPTKLGEARKKIMIQAATTIAEAIDLSGSVRIDFLAQSSSEMIWVNELNTLPGSLAYFLWEAAEPKVSFPELLDQLLAEAFSRQALGIFDPVQAGTAIFRR